jgi:hypothetical protein
MKITFLRNITPFIPIEDRIHGATAQKTVFLSCVNFVCRKKAISFNITVLREKNRIDTWLFM